MPELAVLERIERAAIRLETVPDQYPTLQAAIERVEKHIVLQDGTLQQLFETITAIARQSIEAQEMQRTYNEAFHSELLTRQMADIETQRQLRAQSERDARADARQAANEVRIMHLEATRRIEYLLFAGVFFMLFVSTAVAIYLHRGMVPW